MRRAALLLLSLLLLNACYSFTPVQGPAPERGARIRLHLAEPRDVRLTHVTGNEVVLVSGELVRISGDTVVVSASSLRARSGYEFIATGETVRVPRSEIALLQHRRFSPARSGLLAGAMIVGATLLGSVVQATGGGGEIPGGGQGQ